MSMIATHNYSIDRNGEHRSWDVFGLWKAAEGLKVFDLDIETIAELDEDCWFAPYDSPTVRQVIDHARRMKYIILSNEYPIILSADGRVMDGMHRLAKACLENRRTIKAVRFEHDPKPDLVRPSVDQVTGAVLTE